MELLFYCHSLGKFREETGRKETGVRGIVLQGAGGGQIEVETVQRPDHLRPDVSGECSNVGYINILLKSRIRK